MKTKFEAIHDDWILIKNACRTTVNKKFTDKEPSNDFKKSLLIAEHSPIRLFEVFWSWDKIKYWVSTEWSRHKFEKFISTQRNDRQKKYDRNEAPQGSLVDYNGFANMQSLIDVWRKRLCFQATSDARSLAEDFKVELHKTHVEEANVLVPNCVYRGGCSEMCPCGWWSKFLDWCKENNRDISSIQSRYDAYNDMFYEKHKED